MLSSCSLKLGLVDVKPSICISKGPDRVNGPHFMGALKSSCSWDRPCCRVAAPSAEDGATAVTQVTAPKKKKYLLVSDGCLSPESQKAAFTKKLFLRSPEFPGI